VAEAENYDAVKELVARDVGYAVHVKSLVEAEVASGRLAVLRLAGRPLLGELAVAFQRRPVVSPLIEEFVRALRAEPPRQRAAPGKGASRRPSPRAGSAR
jgi:DNA-binding transcriptional LysR family regulator